MKKTEKYFINKMIKIESTNISRCFICAGDAVCENNEGVTVDINSGITCPLVKSLDDVPADIKSGYVALEGIGSIGYRKLAREEKDDILKNFDTYYSKALRKMDMLENGKERDLAITAASIKQMLSFQSEYLYNKYPNAIHKLV